MPFTLCHPAVVIFSKNKKFNLLGLILGSMAPDFIYFLLFNPSSNLGHTFLGFILFNLPLCFLLNFLILKVIKDPFIINLPFKFNHFYIGLLHYNFNFKSIKNNFIFAYSCLIGMLTHVIWDSFTHNTGYFVLRLRFLRKSLNLFNYQVPIFKILQHGSTFIGFLVIVYFFFSIRKYSTEYIKSNKFIYHLIAILIQIIVILLSYILFDTFGIGRLVVTFINGLFIGYFISSIVYKYKF